MQSHWALQGTPAGFCSSMQGPRLPAPSRDGPAAEPLRWAHAHAYLPLLVADPPIEFFALQAQEVLSRVDNATLDGDGPGCVDIVTGDHADCDTCPLALADGFWDL